MNRKIGETRKILALMSSELQNAQKAFFIYCITALLDLINPKSICHIETAG